MAQVTLRARAFRTAPATATATGSNMKNIADLIVAKGTNEAGKVTNPEVYQKAIEFLKNGRDAEDLDIDVQKKIAGYENSLKSLSNRKQNQKRSVDDFRRLQDSVSFNDMDAEFRNPWRLLENTILENDRILSNVLDSIESKSANEEDVGSLEDYSKELAQTIDELDNFRVQLSEGSFTPGKTFDTFIYVLNSDPDGLGIKGGTIMPTRLLPKGYQRTNESFTINGGYISVAIPTATDKKGKIYGSLGGQIYKASDSKTPLRYRSEKPGTFSLSDETVYSKKKSGISNGMYAQGTLGYDDGGNPILGLLKRGDDGKLYSVSGDTREQLKGVAAESQKLNGYIETLNARDFSNLYGKAESLKFEPMQAPQPNSSSLQPNTSTPSGAVYSAPPTAPISSTEFFGGRNQPTRPAEPKIGSSAPDIIEKGKSFFRTNPLTKPFVEGFFGKK